MDFNNRQYDPQIGRFLQVDPLAAFGGQDMMSPYAAMGNMPEMMVDPLGLSPGLDRAETGASDQAGASYAGNLANLLGAGISGGGGGGGSFGDWSGMGYALRALGNVVSIGNNAIGTTMYMLGQGSSVSSIARDYTSGTGMFSSQSGVGGISAYANKYFGGGAAKQRNRQNNSFGVFFDGMDLYYAGFNPVLDKIAKGSGLRNYSIHKSDHVMSADDATDGAFNQIVNFNNANPDAPIFLYGYSYGGVLANHLAKRLDAVGVKIAYMATVDAANGWWSASVDRSIPNNVEWNDNFYQTTESPIGSRGYPNTGVNVHNYQMRNADHHSIDEATSTMITRMMQVFLNSQYQTSKP